MKMAMGFCVISAEFFNNEKYGLEGNVVSFTNGIERGGL